MLCANPTRKGAILAENTTQPKGCQRSFGLEVRDRRYQRGPRPESTAKTQIHRGFNKVPIVFLINLILLNNRTMAPHLRAIIDAEILLQNEHIHR